MAFMSQEHKGRIAAALKQVVPPDWKYSLGVHHHSMLMMTIRRAPVDFLELYKNEDGTKPMYCAVNVHYLEKRFSGPLLQQMQAIIKVLNLDNHDRSDISTDYHDRGHYEDLSIGRWNQPFLCTATPPTARQIAADAAGEPAEPDIRPERMRG